VVLLQYKGIELGSPGEAGRQVARGTEEQMDADGEVGRVQQRAAPGFHQPCDSRQFRAPSGRARHRRNPGLDQPLEIGDHRVGTGELDRHLRSGEPLTGQGGASNVLPVTDDGVDDMPPLGGELGHRPAHPAVAYHRQSHEDRLG